MIKKLEILLINITCRSIGINCSEIKKVITDVPLKNDANVINKHKKNADIYKIGSFFNIKELEYNSLIIIDSNNEKNLIISTPIISGIVSAELYDILVVPEFIRNKQDPFFLWGFLKNKDELISLITFSYFN